MVIYTSFDYSSRMPFARPLSMFSERVAYQGAIVPRFQLVTPLDPNLPYYPYMPKE
jgi:hypothetical protein